MHLIKWIVAVLVIVVAVVFLNLPSVKMKLAYSNYEAAYGVMAQDRVIKKAKKIMSPASLPFVLDIYRYGEDVKFAEAMVGTCRGIEANNALWDIARQPDVDPLIRTICLAHLLSRGQLDVWPEITEQDIDTICNSPPHHVVFWKTILLRNTGHNYRVFKGDEHPARPRFRNVFHECIEMYDQRQFERKMREME